ITQLHKVINAWEVELYHLREQTEIFINIELQLDTTSTDTSSTEAVGHVVVVKQDWEYSNYTPHIICQNTPHLSWSYGVALDNNENIYVTNNGSNNISVV
ncbi:hypothetical protein, partial [Salmonella sp. s54836]|uniref:hypothetical protein n=1 Tax=Salmonella sp. s54836 TaxID=3159673 RepID=UPI003980EA8D